MGLFSFGTKKSSLDWNKITTADELHHFLNEVENPVLFFKHSTRCSISAMVLSRLESDWKTEDVTCELVFIDLIAYRTVSNLLSEITGVEHQSPQAILWKNGKVVHHASHNGIRFEMIKENL